MNNSCLTDKLNSAYEEDFQAWTIEQAQFLQEGKWSCLDIPNLVEEIESLGRQERQELENRLGVLLGHLLKWEFQPSNRSRSWYATIREQRRRIRRLLDRSPSLQPYLHEAMTIASMRSRLVQTSVILTNLFVHRWMISR